MDQDLYDVLGTFVAKRQDEYLFNRRSKWIGWFPWNDAHAVDVKGKYLGSVVGNRLLHLSRHAHRSTSAYAGYAGYCSYIGLKGSVGKFVDEVGERMSELRAAGVSEHRIKALYPEGPVAPFSDVPRARIEGQQLARAGKSLGDLVGW